MMENRMESIITGYVRGYIRVILGDDNSNNGNHT